MSRVILSLCDFTGNWPAPYRDAGYDVRLVDLEHGQDVRLLDFPDLPVHGILAAPPCTVFAASGSRWPRTDEEMRGGLSVVDACLRVVLMTRPAWWCLENPVGKLRRYLGPPVARFHPFEFGDPYPKRTCLWGSFVMPGPLFTGPTEVEPVGVRPGQPAAWYSAVGGKSKRTKRHRSATPMGFARAFFECNP